MSCKHSICTRRQRCSTCRPQCCAKKPDKASSKRPSPASAGCSSKLTLLLTWELSTLVPGKRR